MPIPVVGKTEKDGETWYDWLAEDDLPQSIGRLSGFMGNSGVLLRAYVYMRMVGRDGMRRLAEYATLNANYLMAKLSEAGFELAFPERRASHEFIVTLKTEAKSLDHDGDGPRQSTAGPQLPRANNLLPVAGARNALLIEPTETESKETLDNFVAAMIAIATEANAGKSFKEAPYTMPVRRLDDVKAARQLDLAFRPEQ